MDVQMEQEAGNIYVIFIWALIYFNFHMYAILSLFIVGFISHHLQW